MAKIGFFHVAQSDYQLTLALKAPSSAQNRISKRLIVLEFAAKWCGLCNLMAPKLEV